MGLSISSLINNISNQNQCSDNNEVENPRNISNILSDNIYVRKIKPIAKNVIDTVKKTYFNTAIYMNSGINIPNNENLGVCSCSSEKSSIVLGTPELPLSGLESSILFCVFLDNDVQGYIKIQNSKNEDIIKQNIKKLDDFIMTIKISYLREIGYSSDYIYSWINLIDKVDDSIKNYSEEFENKEDPRSSKDVFKTILLKKGKNLPVAYDRKITTLKIKIISEILQS